MINQMIKGLPAGWLPPGLFHVGKIRLAQLPGVDESGEKKPLSDGP